MQISEQIELKNTGPLKSNGKCDRILLGLLAIGLIVFMIGLLINAERAWYNYLINFFFFASLALGGLVFVAVQYSASAAWSISVRRIAEGMASFLPVSLILLVILFLGLKHIYNWAEYQPGNFFTATKKVYLTSFWFMARELFFFLLWILFAFLLVRNSLKQDQTKDAAITRRNKILSIIFLIVFGYSYTFSSIDLLMSLEDHFYSTIFGVYCFSGMFLSGMAAVAIIAIALRKHHYLENAIEKKHLHDLGTWLMAFSVFMIYIGFSQYMLIWYTDLPHEIGFMITRSTHGWQFLFALLPLLKWLLPFIVLMPEKNRANPRVLTFVAYGILLGHWLDMYWIIVPAFSEHFRMISWMEIGILLGFTGIFGLVVRRFYKSYPLLASGDPNLDTCVKGRYLHV